MVMPFIVLAVSTALFFFYFQATCERVLRREFDRPYFLDVIKAIRLEFPLLRQELAENTPLRFSEVHLVLRCDFVALEYLLKHSDRKANPLSVSEKLLILYCRFLLFSMPVRHAFKLREKQAVLKLTTILQFFANLTGERLNVTPVGASTSNS